jgi:hypothetical protein
VGAAATRATPTFNTPSRAQSRYGLLTAFYEQLARGAGEVGLRVSPDRNPDEAALFVFFNFVQSPEMVFQWIGPRRAPTALVQWIVDHPLAMDRPLTDLLVKQGGYRLACVAEDEMHLLGMRWPDLVHLKIWHGVPDEAICDEASIEESHRGREGSGESSRDIGVLFTGSIASDEELAKFLAMTPSQLHRACHELVAMRLAHPGLGFTQAFDIAMPAPLRSGDPWGLMALVFRYTTAALNRERRTRLLAALQGLPVTVAGVGPWERWCTGTIRFAGEAEYATMPEWNRRAKVSIAINPTQFTHAFSERLLLSMASGAATVTDDRLWVRDQFVPAGGEAGAAVFASQHPATLRARVEDLLRRPDERVRLATTARAMIVKSHRWAHRVEQMVRAVGMG